MKITTTFYQHFFRCTFAPWRYFKFKHAQQSENLCDETYWTFKKCEIWDDFVDNVIFSDGKLCRRLWMSTLIHAYFWRYGKKIPIFWNNMGCQVLEKFHPIWEIHICNTTISVWENRRRIGWVLKYVGKNSQENLKYFCYYINKLY